MPVQANLESPWTILILLVVLLVMFGGKKIPELAKGLGEGIRNFKTALKGDEEKSEAKKDEEKVEVKK